MTNVLREVCWCIAGLWGWDEDIYHRLCKAGAENPGPLQRAYLELHCCGDEDAFRTSCRVRVNLIRSYKLQLVG